MSGFYKVVRSTRSNGPEPPMRRVHMRELTQCGFRVSVLGLWLMSQGSFIFYLLECWRWVQEHTEHGAGIRRIFPPPEGGIPYTYDL